MRDWIADAAGKFRAWLRSYRGCGGEEPLEIMPAEAEEMASKAAEFFRSCAPEAPAEAMECAEDVEALFFSSTDLVATREVVVALLGAGRWSMSKETLEKAEYEAGCAQRILREIRVGMMPGGIARQGIDKALAHLERCSAALVDRLAAPEWTKEAPRVPGWYWRRMCHGSVEGITAVAKTMKGGVDSDELMSLQDGELVHEMQDAEWLGPLTPGAPAPEHSCAVRSNRACVWLADGTKVVIRRGKGAESAEVWPEVTPQGRVTIQEAPAPSPEPGWARMAEDLADAARRYLDCGASLYRDRLVSALNAFSILPPAAPEPGEAERLRGLLVWCRNIAEHAERGDGCQPDGYRAIVREIDALLAPKGGTDAAPR